MLTHGQERNHHQVEQVTGTGRYLLSGGAAGVVDAEIVTGVVSRPESERWCSN